MEQEREKTELEIFFDAIRELGIEHGAYQKVITAACRLSTNEWIEGQKNGVSIYKPKEKIAA